MKKLKKLYKEHRVFTILMAVVLVCVVLIATVLFKCFYIGNGTDKYGNRLEGIEKHKISESRQKKYETETVKENTSKLESVDVSITGKIIYITMDVNPGVSLVEAQSIAQKSLEKFSEKEQGFYDIHITLKQKATETNDGFITSGAKNKNSEIGLEWNNNRQTTDTATDDKATEKEE